MKYKQNDSIHFIKIYRKRIKSLLISFQCRATQLIKITQKLYKYLTAENIITPLDRYF